MKTSLRYGLNGFEFTIRSGCDIALALMLIAATATDFSKSPATAERRVENTTRPVSELKTDLARAMKFWVVYAQPASVNAAVTLFRKAIATAPNESDRRTAMIGLATVLGLSAGDVEERREILTTLLADADWSKEESLKIAYQLAQLHLHSLRSSPCRDLPFAMEICKSLITNARAQDRFDLQIDAEVLLTRIIEEVNGNRIALDHDKKILVSASSDLDSGIADRKRVGLRQRLKSVTAAQNLGLFALHLVESDEMPTSRVKLQDMDQFVKDHKLHPFISGAIFEGLEDLRQHLTKKSLADRLAGYSSRNLCQTDSGKM
jgi:hypothetical protein